MSHVRLHAKPGVTQMHIDDDVHHVAKDGTFTVPAHQVDAALSIGASHTPVGTPIAAHDRLADLEARVAMLELNAAGTGKRK
jgi:hypothetical protein